MVDFPIQQGNWFSSLRQWRASRAKHRRCPAGPAPEAQIEVDGASRREAGTVDLSRLAMAAPPDA